MRLYRVMLLIISLGIAGSVYARFPVVSISDEEGTGIADVTATGELKVSIQDVASSSTTSDVTAYQPSGTSYNVTSSSADTKITSYEPKSSTLQMFAVSVPSTTATALRAANVSRTGITISNFGGQIVFISTFSTTVTSSLFPLAANDAIGDEYKEEKAPYTGTWFAITVAGQAANDVRIIEKSE